MDLVEHHETSEVTLQVELWIGELRQVVVGFKVQIDAVPQLGHLQSQGGLAHLAWPEQDDGRHLGEPLQEERLDTPWDHP